jgi:hypothetical protein
MRGYQSRIWRLEMQAIRPVTGDGRFPAICRAARTRSPERGRLGWGSARAPVRAERISPPGLRVTRANRPPLFKGGEAPGACFRTTPSLRYKFQTAEEMRVRILAARCARALRLVSPLRIKRAQGKPGAGCTRGPRATKSTGVGPQVNRSNSGFPCAMVLRLTSCSSR